METVSINFQIPEDWHELSDKQLQYVYQMFADDCSCQREQRSNLFEPMPSAAELESNQLASYVVKGNLTECYFSKLRLSSLLSNMLI